MPSSRREFLKHATAGLAAALLLPARAADAKPRPPNVVFILADDIGYGDLGCYGATKVRTPNCDRLAREGLRFTDAHSPSSMCTPTRYAILTGQYAWRHPPVARGVLDGDAPLSIAPGRVTWPSLMKQAGYATGAIGKWHLGLGAGGAPDYNGELKPGPLEIGFDYFFGFPATGDRVPCVYIENHHVVGLDPADPIRCDYRVKRGDPESFVNGVPRIGKMTGGTAARWKDEELADTITKKAVGFIEQHKDEPFFLYFATHDIHVPRVPNPRFRGQSGAGVRGDVIQEFDGSVGEVLAALDRLKLADRTLVIVTSDNGGVLDTNGPDKVNSGTVETNRGHAQNGILRGHKGQLYEGGHRVPLLIRWPERIKPGVSDRLVCQIDLLNSFAALTGRDLPADAAPDSFNVLPALLGEADAKGRGQLVMHAGSGALGIREGEWKLIPGPSPELYNLATDPSEEHSLAKDRPKKVRELSALLDQLRTAGRSRP